MTKSHDNQYLHEHTWSLMKSKECKYSTLIGDESIINCHSQFALRKQKVMKLVQQLFWNKWRRILNLVHLLWKANVNKVVWECHKLNHRHNHCHQTQKVWAAILMKTQLYSEATQHHDPLRDSGRTSLDWIYLIHDDNLFHQHQMQTN